MPDHIEQIHAQRYAPKPYLWRENIALVLGIILFAAFLLLMGVIWLTDRPETVVQSIIFSGFLLLFLGFFGLLFKLWWIKWRASDQCIWMTDAEGIWPEHLGKTQGLVRWAQIDGIRYHDSVFFQKLYLYNGPNQVAQIDTCLDRYSHLCEEIMMQMNWPVTQLPVTYRNAGRWFVLSAWTIIAVLCCRQAGLFAETADLLEQTLCAGGLFFLFIFMAYSTPIALTIDEHGVIFHYQWIRQPAHVRWIDMERIVLQGKGSSAWFNVWIEFNQGRPLALDAFTSGWTGKPELLISCYRALRQSFDKVKKPGKHSW